MANRRRPTNRPTDPFGGPRRGPTSTISTSVALIALAIIVLLQWTGGDLGGLLGRTAPTGQPTVAQSSGREQPPEDDAEAQVAPTATAAKATPKVTAAAKGTATPRATRAPTPQANAPPAARASDLPVVAYAELPPEAHDTIRLIDQGGPFPFRKDGTVFQNRERILPRQPEGYYREYTVITPGEDDRGARRIVTGADGEMYYTDDHYDSFREIIR